MIGYETYAINASSNRHLSVVMLFALDEWVLVGRAAEYFAALACGSKLYVLMYVVSMYNNPN